MFGAVRIHLNAKVAKMAFKGVLFTTCAFIRNSHKNGSMRQFRRLCGVLCGSVLCVHAVSVPAILGALCGVLGRLICWAVVRSVHLQKWLCASCEALQLYFCIADGLKLGAVLPALYSVMGLFFRRCCWAFNGSTRRGVLI